MATHGPQKALYNLPGCSGPVHGFAGHRWKTHIFELYEEVWFPLEASTLLALLSDSSASNFRQSAQPLLTSARRQCTIATKA
jgi:hypothetical protein